MRYTYPAIFEPEEGLYNITFPDLPECYTSGDDLADAIYQAQDVLSDVLADYEEQNRAMPAASDINAISAASGCIVVPVLADTDAWRRAHNTKAVKKTLTIPQWLDTAAQHKGINFSQVLQDALRAQLNL